MDLQDKKKTQTNKQWIKENTFSIEGLSGISSANVFKETSTSSIISFSIWRNIERQRKRSNERSQKSHRAHISLTSLSIISKEAQERDEESERKRQR